MVVQEVAADGERVGGCDIQLTTGVHSEVVDAGVGVEVDHIAVLHHHALETIEGDATGRARRGIAPDGITHVAVRAAVVGGTATITSQYNVIEVDVFSISIAAEPYPYFQLITRSPDVEAIARECATDLRGSIPNTAQVSIQCKPTVSRTHIRLRAEGTDRNP